MQILIRLAISVNKLCNCYLCGFVGSTGQLLAEGLMVWFRIAKNFDTSYLKCFKTSREGL